jgi:hypothetical protein
MGPTCSTNGEHNKRSRNVKGRENSEGLGVLGR